MGLKIMVMTALLLFPASLVLADGGHSNSTVLSEDIEKFMKDEQSEGGSHEGHTMTPEEHGNMTNEAESSSHSESTEGGGHGHGGEAIPETPPNYTVLGVFGVINLSFIVVGLWNKRIRKKVEIDGNAGKTA